MGIAEALLQKAREKYHIEHSKNLEPDGEAWAGKVGFAKSNDWFAPSFDLNDQSRQQIYGWVSQQQWPPGFDMYPPDKYHVTGLYSPSGFANQANHQWVQQQSGQTFPAKVDSVETFGDGSSPKGHPIVLTLDSQQLIQHGLQLQDAAEQNGIDVQRHPDGYRPHITIGYSPSPVTMAAPQFQVNVGPLMELHTRYDQNKIAGLNGDLPEDLGFQWEEVPPTRVGGTPMQSVEARSGGSTIGEMRLRPEGGAWVIDNMWVEDDWQRRGVATELWKVAQERLGDVEHASQSERSPAGQGWFKAVQANILDDIKGELDPDVFERSDDQRPIVKPKIQSWVRAQVYRTMREAGWPDPTQYLSLVLTGSLTTYQWSEISDFDVSLFVDTVKFPEWVRSDLIALMTTKMDGTIVPGTTHPIQCFVVPGRITRDQLYQPGLRSGYDLDKEQWIVPPERNRVKDVKKLFPAVIAYCRMVEDKMRSLLKYNKYAATDYWHMLHERRRSDQAAGLGDFAESNIVYKWIANAGLFDAISEATGEYLAHTSASQWGDAVPALTCPHCGAVHDTLTQVVCRDCGAVLKTSSDDWVEVPDAN
jgi:2'-5' RNA ligase